MSKKIIAAIFGILGIVGIIEAFTFKPHPATGTLASNSPSASTTASSTPIDTSSLSSTSTSTTTKSTAKTATTSAYKNGTYTGDTIDVGYGPVQVQAIISGGKVTDVKALQTPSDRSVSVMIASQAVPILKQETLTAQSSNIDMVSGATATSTGYIQSLNSALLKAKNS